MVKTRLSDSQQQDCLNALNASPLLYLSAYSKELFHTDCIVNDAQKILNCFGRNTN